MRRKTIPFYRITLTEMDHGTNILTIFGTVGLHIWDTNPYSKLSTRPSHSEAKLRKLKNKPQYCSTCFLFPAIFERTVEPEKFCLSVRKASFYPKIRLSMINDIKISRSHTAFYCDILILWIKPYNLLTNFIPL